MEIVPAILSDSFEDIKEKASLVKDAVLSVQIDICDGHFVPNKTWPYVGGGGEFERMILGKDKLPECQKLNYEIDLMVRNPETIIDDWVKIGASRIVLHFGSSDKLSEVIEEWGRVIELGLAVLPNSTFADFADLVDKVSFVQFMGIQRIGFQSEVFDDRVFQKIGDFRKHYPNKIISVDGGVNLTNAPRLLTAGVNRLVVGSAIWVSDDPVQAIADFKKLI